MLDAFDLELAPFDRQLRAFARRQPGCRALIERLYGVGPVSATAILAELGDCRRFSSSDNGVRHAGLDITVYQSDAKRAPGHLSHEGPELLRWALYEAAVCAARAGSPDHGYHLQVAERLGHTRACLSVARKLCRRAHHLLRELGEEALAPSDQPTERRRSRLPPNPVTTNARERPRHQDALRPAAPDPPPALTGLGGLERQSGRKQPPAGTTPDRSSCRRTIYVRAQLVENADRMPASIMGELGPRARDGQHVRCSAAAVFRGSSSA
jgi:hypothetical protein